MWCQALPLCFEGLTIWNVGRAVPGRGLHVCLGGHSAGPPPGTLRGGRWLPVKFRGPRQAWFTVQALRNLLSLFLWHETLRLVFSSMRCRYLITQKTCMVLCSSKNRLISCFKNPFSLPGSIICLTLNTGMVVMCQAQSSGSRGNKTLHSKYNSGAKHLYPLKMGSFGLN